MAGSAMRMKKMAKAMGEKSRLGAGGRFHAIEEKAEESGAKNPAGVAAAIGIKKYGKKKMAKWAAAGKK